MSNRKDIQDELKGMDAHFSSENNNGPYSVPQGYFEGLASSILSRVKEVNTSPSAREELMELSPLLAGISKEMPYSIPPDYFFRSMNSLPAVVGMEVPSPVLSAIGKTMPYSVPDGYFDQLPERILSSLPGHRTRVIPMMARKWMRIAVAALIGGIICTSGYFYFANNHTHSSPGASVVATLKSVPTKELDEFLKTIDANTASANQTAQNSPSQSGKDVKKMLQDVPENDIDAFLKQVPSENDDVAIN